MLPRQTLDMENKSAILDRSAISPFSVPWVSSFSDSLKYLPLVRMEILEEAIRVIQLTHT